MTLDATQQQVNYYEVLGANPMDQIDRIEDLFRQLAYEAEKSGDHSKVPQAVEAFKVLRDPAQRHQYDQHLAHQQHVVAQQTQQSQQAQQAQFANPAVAAPAQYQPTPSQPVEQQPAQYQPTPSQQAPQQQAPQQQFVAPQPQPEQQPPAPLQPTPAPEQPQSIQYQGIPSDPTPEQPAVSIPNVHPESAPAEAASAVAPETQTTAAENQDQSTEEPEFCAKTAQKRRREILAMFYKRRRDDAKNPGLAIGGIEQKVDYTYEVLEFHLWFMQQKEWLLRLESGMFTITYPGVEEHEKNLIEGLVK